MGSAAALLDTVNPPNDPLSAASAGKTKAKSKLVLPSSKDKKEMQNGRQKHRLSASQSGEESAATRKMPKRSAACSSFKEKSVRISKNHDIIETKKDREVDEEIVAVGLTAGQDEDRPNRRLSDFIFHDSDGKSQQIEMLEVDDLFISGVILPASETHDKEKDEGVRCGGFGRIESWSISGYEDGCPVVWVSTDISDYECLKPAGCYKKLYDQFSEKARVCVEVYKKISKASGGNPDTGLDELLAGVIRSMSGSKHFSSAASIRDFIISQGNFVYDQLIGLDETLKQNDLSFAELPVLISLKEESLRSSNMFQPNVASVDGSLKISSSPRGRKRKSQSGTVIDDESVKLAKILQEEEYWKSMKQRRNQGSASSVNKFYIKINEDEITNDYPLPAYYKTSDHETDEYVVFDNEHDLYEIDELPRSMLHNWSLYNSDSRLISLELLPMKPCADIDVSIFGSGVMTADDGSGFCLDDDPSVSSSGSVVCDVDGIPIFLSSIKEWMIEFGSSMIFISIRTDMAWYRLGKPSKQYAPWYKPVLKTAKLAISIITLLKEQNRVSRLSFSDVVRRVSEFGKDHPAYISSTPDVVERYIVVHGQIILQQFSEFPDENIKRCSFLFGLSSMMEQRHHTKWIMKKKKVLQRIQPNLNPRATIQAIVSKKKLMQATTTRLINRIWGDYYSNYSPESPNDVVPCERPDDDGDDPDENEEDDVIDEKPSLPQKTEKPRTSSVRSKACGNSKDIKWEGGSVGKNSSGWALFKRAIVRGNVVSVGGAVHIEHDKSDEFPAIYFVEYMFETPNGSKMCHGRKMQRGSDTLLGNTANEREVFLTNECLDFELGTVNEIVVVQMRLRSWGHQYRKEDSDSDRIDREKAEERKRKGMPVEYYCKNLYCPEKGAFISIHSASIGLGSGTCESCKLNETQEGNERFCIMGGNTSFVYKGVEYAVNDFVYVRPHQFSCEEMDTETFKGGRNVGLRAYVVCQLVELIPSKASKNVDPSSLQIKLRRFFRPEDISDEKAYVSDIREVYYSEEAQILSVEEVEGKCEVRKKQDLSSLDSLPIIDHIFFCEYMYDPSKGSLRKLPAQIKLCYSKDRAVDDAISRRKKGKCKEGEQNQENNGEITKNLLETLDIFSGCGGLSEGLEKSGASQIKWAIEYEEPAGDAFKLNHPEALVFVKNCNVILKAVMDKCGDSHDCISTTEAAELAASMSEKELSDLPLPGQVDFINGGPPCQGFSGMNRFNQSTWSKVQCEMILAFLSFAEYFRPKYFLLENVRNFVSFNKGQTFRLTLASLLEMGYQVRFGILEAGAFGVSQSRKRAFIWAAAPTETLPEWPEPMHVFSAPELKIAVSPTDHYAAARSTACGAPFRAITVRDTIGDLPQVGNGASNPNLEYQNEAVSWFQKKIRGNSANLTDHISKEMNELNVIRCQHIPRRPGADWHDLPDEKVKLSSGEVTDLIPWCLPNTAKRHNQWKGLFGRLDWGGNFPTSITDPQPMGKVGMCFHPEQDRILTVRECARSQGFPDCYMFSGNIQHKHRQIGNAVPPPLAFALGRKLKEAVHGKGPVAG